MTDWSEDMTAAPRDGTRCDLRITRTNGDVFEVRKYRWVPRTPADPEHPDAGEWRASDSPLAARKVTAWRLS